MQASSNACPKIIHNKPIKTEKTASLGFKKRVFWTMAEIPSTEMVHVFLHSQLL